MFEPIDYIKLMEQDPEFKKFFTDVVIKLFTTDPDSQPFIGSVHSFYTIGNTAEQVVQWVRNMKAGQ